jgi:hypothetical protein
LKPIFHIVIPQFYHWLAIEIEPPHHMEIGAPDWWLFVALYSTKQNLSYHIPGGWNSAQNSDWSIQRRINHGKVEWFRTDPRNIDRENIEELDQLVLRYWRLRALL